MSKPGTIYRITHQPYDKTEDIQEVVDISDNDNLIDDSADPVIIDLIPGGDPVLCEVIDNDEDAFTVIKSQKLKLRVLTDNPVSMSTFASGSDGRWSVHNYIGDKTLFKGFMNLDDLQVDFMPDPNELIITATDSLGLLKEVPLTDFDGNNPVGEYPIGELLAMALSKTGLSLGIKAAFNIKKSGSITDIGSAGSGSQHFFSSIYLNAKTFEDEIGTCINCYEVIKRILGEEARIFQRQGYWWILRVDEIENLTRGLYITEFDEYGQDPMNLGEITFEKEIGKDSPYTMFFAREQTLVIPSRPLGSVELTYDYDSPREILENIDFERGDYLSDLADVVVDGETLSQKTYSIDSWLMIGGNPLSPSAPTVSPYILRRFNQNDYEKQRYIVIPDGSSFVTREFLVSNPIHITKDDKFTFSVDWKITSDISLGTSFASIFSLIVLKGDDGNWYKVGGRGIAGQGGYDDEDYDQIWLDTSGFTTNSLAGVREFDTTLSDETGWHTQTWEPPPCPVSGLLYIWLSPMGNPTNNYETHFQNANFDYIPHVNGSYQKYSRQSQKVTQDTANLDKYRAKRERQVYVSDSPRFLFKGAFLQPLIYNTIFSGSVQFFASSGTFQISGYQLALFRVGQRLNIQDTTSNNITCRVTAVSYSLVGTVTVITVDETLVNETDATTTVQEMTFELADAFYNAAVFPSGPPDSTYIHPYSEIQVHDVFNQFAIDRRMFQAVIQGMDFSVVDGDDERDNAHLIHKWFFRDLTEDTINRCFSLLTFNHNHRNQEWVGVFREVDRFGTDKVYANRTFKYKT